MSEAAIQKIVCMAVVSDRFRAQLLGMDRAAVLSEHGLIGREYEALMEISASTIEDFAAGVERLLRVWRRAEAGGRVREPVPLAGCLVANLPPGRD
jgi:hypothetical protein